MCPIYSTGPSISPKSPDMWDTRVLKRRSFSLDTATDYLLGASVDSLDNGDNQFATYFNEVQKVQSIMSKLGFVFWPA